MERIVDLLRKRGADAFYPGQILYPGPRDFPDTAKLLEQFLSPFSADSGNCLQGRLGSGPGTPGAVPRDGKAVGFVAYLLDEMQCPGLRCEIDRR